SRHFRLSPLQSIEKYIHSLSLVGKLVLSIPVLLFAGSTLVMLWKVNSYFMVAVPQSGGEVSEGVIGLPRFINPVLAVTDGDKDLSSLIYSGLMRYTKDGELVPDLAESYSLSPDGK